MTTRRRPVIGMFCRRCEAFKDKREVLETAHSLSRGEHPNFLCPDCGGVCDPTDLTKQPGPKPAN